MTWLVVARWMALDARRSRGLWVVVAVFAGVAGLAAVIPGLAMGASLSADRAMAFLVAPLRLVVALTALLAGFGAIAGPRSGGQLKLLLGLPVDRTALVVGAFVGRTAVVLGGVVGGLLVAALALRLSYGAIPGRNLLAFGGLLGLLAVSVTAVAVGLSAATASRSRAAVAAVGAFVLFEFFWPVVPAGAHYLVEGTLPGAVVPAWVVLLERLQPLTAYGAAADLTLPAVEQGVQLSAAGAEATRASGPTPLADRIEGPVPRYLDPAVGVAVLLAWTVVPLAVGVWRFRRADL